MAYEHTYYGLLKKFPNLKNGIDYELRDDGKGCYISAWKVSDPKPSLEELEKLGIQYKQELIDEEKKQELLRVSAISKLEILGLTKEEIEALIL